jgi:integrase
MAAVTRSVLPSLGPGAASSRFPISSHRICAGIFGGLDPAADLVFTSPEGSPLRHSNFSRRVWLPALTAVGLEGVHIHDLRHTGNQFSAEAGANLRELMERMGHDSTRAASIYLHSSPERQQAIASQVGRNARKALGNSKRSGTRTARGQSMREAGE